MSFSKRLLFLFALSATAFSHANAQATRTWVSGVGDDANPCSRTAPCKTFAGAISKTAANGEIDALDPGGYGAVTITKSITIDGGAGMAGGILASGTNGVNISAGQSDVVTLRNLSILGAGTGLDGVRVNTVKAVHVEHCTIARFTGNGINVQATGPTAVFIDHVTSRDNDTSGATVRGSNTVLTSVMDSLFENNGSGLIASGGSKVTVRNSNALGNSGAGFHADASGAAATLTLLNSASASNGGSGVQAAGDGTSSAVVRMSSVAVFSNGSGLSMGAGGSIFSYGDNQITGGGTITSLISKQ